MPPSSADGRQVRLEPSGHTFVVAEGETILEAALRQGVGLPYGCRNGACGACKGILRSGELAYGDYQERALHPEEKAAGKALTCCTRPLGSRRTWRPSDDEDGKERVFLESARRGASTARGRREF